VVVAVIILVVLVMAALETMDRCRRGRPVALVAASPEA
jgi:hypothetical protein